jgi:protein TonB
MFDKLIESNSAAADFRNRRKYFVLSALIVGCLFLVGVVASIYASEIGLGADQFELSAILAPVLPQDQPEPPRSQAPDRSTSSDSSSDTPTRRFNMARPDETQPTPDGISVVKNDAAARPEYGPFKRGQFDSLNGAGVGEPGPDSGDPGYSTSNRSGSSETVSEREEKVKPAIPEPPALRPLPPRSIGVVNGIAVNLPKPPYPPAAASMNIQGKVDVQVSIDEEGKVTSAKAVSGHPFLRPAAEKAAWNARFTPTLLSKVPVRVTGVIVYNFTRN